MTLPLAMANPYSSLASADHAQTQMREQSSDGATQDLVGNSINLSLACPHCHRNCTELSVRSSKRARGKRGTRAVLNGSAVFLRPNLG